MLSAGRRRLGAAMRMTSNANCVSQRKRDSAVWVTAPASPLIDWLTLRPWISQLSLAEKYDQTVPLSSFTLYCPSAHYVVDQTVFQLILQQNARKSENGRTAFEHHRTCLRVERIFVQRHRTRQSRWDPTTTNNRNSSTRVSVYSGVSIQRNARNGMNATNVRNVRNVNGAYIWTIFHVSGSDKYLLQLNGFALVLYWVVLHRSCTDTWIFKFPTVARQQMWG